MRHFPASRYGGLLAFLLVALSAMGTACHLLRGETESTLRHEPTTCAQSMPAHATADSVCLAIIGDYGIHRGGARAVSRMVHAWKPDFVITTGDNNYPAGRREQMDRNIGAFYHAFIGNYQGAYGKGSPINRFFPVLGNHDWDSGTLGGWYDFFTLPGNERYYTAELGLVELFALDSDIREPDGIGVDSRQAAWLKQRLKASKACYKLVSVHHPPYLSPARDRDNSPALRWPYAEWGADAVFSGHEHLYERLEVDGIPYIIVGNSGHPLEPVYGIPQPQSRKRFGGDWGAMRVMATRQDITYEMWSLAGEVVDHLVVPGACE